LHEEGLSQNGREKKNKIKGKAISRKITGGRERNPSQRGWRSRRAESPPWVIIRVVSGGGFRGGGKATLAIGKREFTGQKPSRHKGRASAESLTGGANTQGKGIHKDLIFTTSNRGQAGRVRPRQKLVSTTPTLRVEARPILRRELTGSFARKNSRTGLRG